MRASFRFFFEDQVFVPGKELKESLSALNAHYVSLPEEVKQQGAMKFASFPPLNVDNLVCRLFDRFLPHWRHDAANPIVLSDAESADNGTL